MKRQLILEDGTVLQGEGFGSERASIGEVVFTTGMTGYQEAITDQSFNGQMIVFTYPLVGNYGVNREDLESIEPTCQGVIVGEHGRMPSNWRSQMSLNEFLKDKDIPGIAGIDTRMLTRKLREVGSMKGWLVDSSEDAQEVLARLQEINLPTNQVAQVSCQKAYPSPGTGHQVVVVDFGLKHSILRELNKRDCQMTVLPYHTSAEEILKLNPDGVMLTNGPGDPKDLPEVIDMIRRIQGKVPIFGICLGHQLFALANHADTYKMPFGHRGFNHPVREVATGRVDFTSQNHGFAVDLASVNEEELMVTHIEINDGSIEGLRHKKYPAFSVQYHPDAAPGPHDGVYLFDEFMDLMDNWKGTN